MLLHIKSSSKTFSFNSAPLYAQSSFLFKATRSVGLSVMAPIGIFLRQLCCITADISSTDQ